MTIQLRSEVSAHIKVKDFSQARRLLTPHRSGEGLAAEDRRWVRHRLALCTYKDMELPAEEALLDALAILGGACGSEDLATTVDHETLSLAGAIHKRLWEVGGDGRALRLALDYYRRARACSDKLEDWTYAAVNLALMLDLVAREEEIGGDADDRERCGQRRAQATGQRRAVVAASDRILAGEEAAEPWWPRATLVEALFGLGAYAEAGALLKSAITSWNPDDWQMETLVRQLATLARLHEERGDDIGAALQALSVVASPEAVRGLLVGKIGMALSGGGFRAALFHVGTLARMAELDLLRHVEVLSCVSGGSILGALYYLELRAELERRADALMDRDAYIAVVERVQDRLLDCLSGNVRTAAFLSALFTLGSPTRRIARLLDDALYRRGGTPSYALRDLLVRPKGTTGFHPKRNNWNRGAKVPILIINATTLNTGHNWQFTASWMGEAPSCIEAPVDAGERLRRLYYTDEAPEQHKAMALNTAVAASAAVPGLFRPVPVEGLYKERTLRLADGGVNDNQGIFGLMEQDCAVMLISDGCGQLAMQPRPGWFCGTVMARANDILMETVRRNAFRILSARLRSRRLRALCFAHLKQGLPVQDVTWEGGTEAASDILTAGEDSGLDRQVQEALAAIRTDLDRFSETECLALMCAGHHIAGRSFGSLASILPVSAAPHTGWRFLRVAPWMRPGGAPAAFLRELTCGRHRLFRGLRLWRAGRRAAAGA